MDYHVFTRKMGKEVPAMTAEEALCYIHSAYRKGAAPGLSRITALLDALGNPQHSLKTIHIAGTNGKGSTAAMTAAILKAAGYRTGLYTSPYLYRFSERMQIDGQQISGDDLGAVTALVRPFADALEDPPTEFELVTAIALTYFAQKKCDIVVLEAGMGGLNDATNAIDVPEAAVITNIGLDHTEFLGDTLERIAANKAGIFKPGGRAVVYPGEPSVENVYRQVCREKGVELHIADFSRLTLCSRSLEGQVFDWGDWKGLPLPLLGEHQLHNAAVVLTLVEVLRQRGWNLTQNAVRQGLSQVRWPGRFDILARDPLFILDGGHNPQCIDALAKNIPEYLAGKRVIALTGVLADKDYVRMFTPIVPYISEFVCITPPSPRKLEGAELARMLTQAGAKARSCGTIPQGVALARELAGPEGAVLAFGSLYSIGAIREALEA